ncbi:TDP-N-acetylfucosamine:lipid II N-acetylfucosaminyltransferase [Marinobacter sp. TBZ242]|uniref:TDP-N-acetylfucosamine:lipid II N-acetylfucosaminyltransferase n=1 Tax=Marinobacter azerbaijanicus TaxID=3050455 RepID=A0ABT7ICW1_9GAMM|nr:TDP-N-acetylfucosamine:lipid II N-acetylfucosaminyltransferase [Marinobacter sp. TBZ242]MDL0431991.1 TDP-N-acetylfucosamine:lipid II N-acetylfucosaminyltransferase [Marinobacter sp. TBZ242]
MILHVGHLDKFIPPFVRFIEDNFEAKRHQFWLKIADERFNLDACSRIEIVGQTRNFWRRVLIYGKLLWKLHQAEKVILHSLLNNNLVVVISFFPWLLPKCYWVIWGGDLYEYQDRRVGLNRNLRELFRRFFIRRVGHLVSYIKGDVELARQWYGAKGTHHECIMYLSNVIDPKMTWETSPNPDHDGLNILLGNSADPSNNHIEALERLLPFKDQNIKIFAPLSYGDQNHAKKVVTQGKEWFGNKFVPMTDFMPFEQYLEFLETLDIAIFNHRRQQAMGNTITLLGMGKTVFIRSDVSHWRFLNGLGIKLNDVESIELCRIAPDEAEGNARVVRSYFSKATLIKQLTDIFEG